MVGLVGAGGMGEVYRARDARLGRDVAIKVLPAAVAADPDRLARFEREAQAIASLSHPNILAVHAFGTEAAAGGRPASPYVVMELLEGQTLRERLADGPLSTRKAIETATAIARGLAAAHDKSLVHRDLKPENVFLVADGQVKVLDFGLARSLVQPGPADASDTIARTDPGTVLGTVGYMAPEQARGAPVDARTDLFALGAVLYEMISGARAFQRDTAADTMSAVLREDPPDLDQRRPDLPPALGRIVQHLLEKDPVERFQSARDVIFALTSLTASGSGARPASPGDASPFRDVAPVEPRRSSRPAPRTIALATGGAVLLTVAAAAAGAWIGRRTAVAPPGWDRFTQVTDLAGEESMPRISPDGGSFVYASQAGGSWDIYAQRLGGRTALLVAGDPKRDEVWPAFSPDGREIAFNESDVDGGIFTIGATGESERRLTDFGTNPAWSPDGRQIAFASEEVASPHDRGGVSTLWLVDAGGGQPRQIYAGDAMQPAWSPSGRRIAFWSVLGGQRAIVTVAADGTDPVSLTSDAAMNWAPAWSPDGAFLYYASDRGGPMGLWRVAVDEATGAASGDPELVSPGVEASADLPSFSADGHTLLFRSRQQSVNPVAIPFDPASEQTGEPRLLVAHTGILIPTSVSPDGAWIALSNLGEMQEDVSLIRDDGSGLRRVTDDAARDRGPRWSPDGRTLTFYSNRDGDYGAWSIRPDGSGLAMLARSLPLGLIYPAISPADGRLSLWLLDGRPALARPPFPASLEGLDPLPNITLPEGMLFPTLWSRDGRFLSGPLMGPGGRPAGVGVYDLSTGKARAVSADRGIWGAPFLPDGRRLIYFTLASELVVVDLSTGERRRVPARLPLPAASDAIAVAPDGRTVYYGAQRVEANVWKADRLP